MVEPTQKRATTNYKQTPFLAKYVLECPTYLSKTPRFVAYSHHIFPACLLHFANALCWLINYPAFLENFHHFSGSTCFSSFPIAQLFNTLHFTPSCPRHFPTFSHHVPIISPQFSDIFPLSTSFPSPKTAPQNGAPKRGPTCAASSVASSASSTTNSPGLQPWPAAVASESSDPAAEKNSTESRGRFWCLHHRVITWQCHWGSIPSDPHFQDPEKSVEMELSAEIGYERVWLKNGFYTYIYAYFTFQMRVYMKAGSSPGNENYPQTTWRL